MIFKYFRDQQCDILSKNIICDFLLSMRSTRFWLLFFFIANLCLDEPERLKSLNEDTMTTRPDPSVTEH